MFAIWANKQIMNTAAANSNKPWDRSNIYCPSCSIMPESCKHILSCDNAGRVETLLKSIDMLKDWLEAGGSRHGLTPTCLHHKICERKGQQIDDRDMQKTWAGPEV